MMDDVKIANKVIALVSKNKPELSINEIRVIIALERAIARILSNKILSDNLIFKGGFVLYKSYESMRFTRDADAISLFLSKKELSDLIIESLKVNLNDGLWYGDIKVEELLPENEMQVCHRFDFAFQIYLYVIEN